MINTQLKLIFIDIPKTGSTAFKMFLVRGFHNFTWQGSTNPAWMSSFCKEIDRHSINDKGQILKNGFVRHEPLISKYMNILGIEKYFTFTIVRDPFERFKSAFIETILHNRYGVKQKTMSDPNIFPNQNLHDPWYINSHVDQNNYFKTVEQEELQAKLILNLLNITAGKGGFEKTGLCGTPIHFWPQHYFTSLTLPSPLNVVIVKYENLKKDFPVLREELSYFTGIDVTKEELPFSEPTANAIFSAFNLDAVDTMGYKFNFEKEIAQQSVNDPNFIKKYPTFDDFLPAFKEEKQRVIEHWLPIIEQNRGMIEHLYAEDYRIFGYSRKS